MTIVPLDESTETKHDVGFLAYLMAATEPELYALALPGETAEERAARLDAAGDILDELAREFRTPVETGDEFEQLGRAA